MSLGIVTTLASLAAGLLAVLLIPFLARRGNPSRAILYGLIGAIFCFSFGRFVAGAIGVAVFDLPGGDGMLLTGGLPMRPLDLLVFAACLALATSRVVARRRAAA